MKKLSFILALVLVLTCGVLAACGDETTETSSEAAESVESKTESSEAAVESSEADESAPAESSGESVDESIDESAPAEDSSAVTTVAGDNAAAGKTYTISGNGKPGEQYTAGLTDGVAGEDTGAYDATWFAFYANQSADPAKLNTVDSMGYIIIDLGEVKNLSKIRVHCGNNKDSGVPSPAWMDCKVADDASDPNAFTFMAELPTKDHNEAGNETLAYWSEVDVSGFSGRYVQINVKVNGTWCWINEIEVYEAAE